MSDALPPLFVVVVTRKKHVKRSCISSLPKGLFSDDLKAGQCLKCVPVEKQTGPLGSPSTPDSIEATFDTSPPQMNNKDVASSLLSHSLCGLVGKSK